jgi:hypothetical protein
MWLPGVEITIKGLHLAGRAPLSGGLMRKVAVGIGPGLGCLAGAWQQPWARPGPCEAPIRQPALAVRRFARPSRTSWQIIRQGG